MQHDGSAPAIPELREHPYTTREALHDAPIIIPLATTRRFGVEVYFEATRITALVLDTRQVAAARLEDHDQPGNPRELADLDTDAGPARQHLMPRGVTQDTIKTHGCNLEQQLCKTAGEAT
eukprot:468288-Alexandrium_andersonii.AAC.1